MRIKTSDDGGLVFESTLDRGWLRVSFERFAHKRAIVILVVFEEPDIPLFHSTVGSVRARFPSYEQSLILSGHQLHLIPIRVWFALVVFAACYAILGIRLMILS